jgi:hypothetical protein
MAEVIIVIDNDSNIEDSNIELIAVPVNTDFVTKAEVIVGCSSSDLPIYNPLQQMEILATTNYFTQREEIYRIENNIRSLQRSHQRNRPLILILIIFIIIAIYSIY